MLDALVVEESVENQEAIARALSPYRVTCVGSVDAAVDAMKLQNFEFFVIGVDQRESVGYSVLNNLQKEMPDWTKPIVCISSRTDISDKAVAFSLGADDYLTTPFDPLELKIRVEARLRKSLRTRGQELVKTVGDLEIDREKYRVCIIENGQRRELPLTQTEFKLLSILAQQAETVITREHLLEMVWGNEAGVMERAVDVHICFLRKKIQESQCQIKAVVGLGYKLMAAKPSR